MEAGLVLAAWAVPESTMAIAKLAKEIATRVRAYRDASKILQSLHEFGYAYHNSLFKKNIDLAVALVARTNDKCFDHALKIQIQQLHQELQRAKDLIFRMVDENGQMHRWWFVWEGERALKRVVTNLGKYQQEFVNFNTIAEATIRNMPATQDTLLPRTILRYISESWENGMFQENRPQIRLCEAEWRQNNGDSIQQIKVLIEEQVIPADVDCGDIERNTQELARHLSGSFHSGGILQCLGYRNSPSLDLVFRVSDELSSPRSLQKLFGEVQSDIGAPLNRRLNLARMLAQSVLSVHTAGFVHKNIRPETILIFQRQEDSSAPTIPDGSYGDVVILTEWQMLRKLNDTSSRRGEEDWDKNIYRHPERQGIKPQTRYNMGHDIYSLGVCLLEIGLWEPLIVHQGCESMERSYGLAPVFYNAAHSLDVPVRMDDNEAFKKLVKPALVRKAVLRLAQQKLPARIGNGYAKVVMDCLTCLDDAEQKEIFKGHRVGAEIEFNKTVLQPLADLNI